MLSAILKKFRSPRPPAPADTPPKTPEELRDEQTYARLAEFRRKKDAGLFMSEEDERVVDWVDCYCHVASELGAADTKRKLSYKSRLDPYAFIGPEVVAYVRACVLSRTPVRMPTTEPDYAYKRAFIAVVTELATTVDEVDVWVAAIRAHRAEAKSARRLSQPEPPELPLPAAVRAEIERRAAIRARAVRVGAVDGTTSGGHVPDPPGGPKRP